MLFCLIETIELDPPIPKKNIPKKPQSIASTTQGKRYVHLKELKKLPEMWHLKKIFQRVLRQISSLYVKISFCSSVIADPVRGIFPFFVISFPVCVQT